MVREEDEEEFYEFVRNKMLKEGYRPQNMFSNMAYHAKNVSAFHQYKLEQKGKSEDENV